MPISPIRSIETRQIHPGHQVDHKPRQMIRRQPIPDVRRQQKSLLTPTLNEVLRHTRIPPAEPDGTPLRDSLRAEQGCDQAEGRVPSPL
jgi:hypothetical protein